MLGPECGTAIIGGVPLGFANVVRPGNIGLVAASGSGLQEVTCLIHNWGGGISHAIGTGGRDLHEKVGAITMLAGLQLLLDDPDTQVIVLLSKPAPPAVAARVLEAAAKATKPIIVAFLGADQAPMQAAGLTMAPTLEEAAQLAMAGVGETVPRISPAPGLKARRPRRYIRGLFAGGTLCTEATLIVQDAIGPVIQPTLTEPCPAAHSCLDLGREEYTRGVAGLIP
jgi:succinyl-CoA synthetase alpha subunit